jgi:hypothetical protein
VYVVLLLPVQPWLIVMGVAVLVVLLLPAQPWLIVMLIVLGLQDPTALPADDPAYPGPYVSDCLFYLVLDAF